MLHPKLIELEKNFQPSQLTQLNASLLKQKQIELWIKRDDLIHPVISGNKWRKLKYILDYTLNKEMHTIISMGGAYSNHLHALAFAGKKMQLKTIGFIRGERPEIISSTLKDAQNWGMELRFVTRSEYRELRKYKIQDDFPGLCKGEYWLPEGGSTDLALKGVGELVFEIEMKFDVICAPCGTGTTIAGLIDSIPEHRTVYGFSALKGGGFLTENVESLSSKGKLNKSNWSILLDYHFGGFAKRNNELLLFMKGFEKQHNIEIEPIYSGKMFYGLFDLIKRDFFNSGQKIIALHTGGLQGKRGYGTFTK